MIRCEVTTRIIQIPAVSKRLSKTTGSFASPASGILRELARTGYWLVVGVSQIADAQTKLGIFHSVILLASSRSKLSFLFAAASVALRLVACRIGATWNLLRFLGYSRGCSSWGDWLFTSLEAACDVCMRSLSLEKHNPSLGGYRVEVIHLMGTGLVKHILYTRGFEASSLKNNQAVEASRLLASILCPS